MIIFKNCEIRQRNLISTYKLFILLFNLLFIHYKMSNIYSKTQEMIFYISIFVFNFQLILETFFDIIAVQHRLYMVHNKKIGIKGDDYLAIR